jgi:metallophosphoesterase (TIGR00282 family)
MNILFIGDVCGNPGRETVSKVLPEIKNEYGVDLVIANGENIAHGRGATRKTIMELLSSGVNFVTSGNHIFRIESFHNDLDDPNLPIIRPANYPDDIIGSGYDVVDLGSKGVALIINLQGAMAQHSSIITCPFRKLDEILDSTIDLHPSAIIVDFHAEYSSDKKALGFYADGRISALFGTHTHVPTADERILPKGTAYVTDAGMTGPQESVLWIKKEIGIRFQKYPYPTGFEIETEGKMVFNSVLIKTNEKGLADKIERIDRVI